MYACDGSDGQDQGESHSSTSAAGRTEQRDALEPRSDQGLCRGVQVELLLCYAFLQGAQALRMNQKGRSELGCEVKVLHRSNMRVPSALFRFLLSRKSRP
jgi:hypothetical protein